MIATYESFAKTKDVRDIHVTSKYILVQLDRFLVVGSVLSGFALLIFMAIGAGLLWAFFSLGMQHELNVESITALVTNRELNFRIAFPLFFFVFGILLIFIPLSFAWNVWTSQSRRPGYTRSLIFDLEKKQFFVSEESFNTGQNPIDKDLPGFPFQDIARFEIRNRTTYSGIGLKRRVIGWYVVCLTKTDGSRFDLWESRSESEATEVIETLSSHVRFNHNDNIRINLASKLPSNIQQIFLGDNCWFLWSMPARFIDKIIGLFIMMGFFLINILFFIDSFVFLILGVLITGLGLVFIFKEILNGITSTINYHAIHLSSEALSIGFIPKKNLQRALDTKAKSDLDFNRKTPNLGFQFKAISSLPLPECDIVRFNVEINELSRSERSIEVLLNPEKNRESKRVTIDYENSSKNQQEEKKNRIVITLAELSIGETIQFQQILEKELRQRGAEANLKNQ